MGWEPAVRTLIVGAGIAGLSTALRLRQLGWPATVVEAASAPRGGGYMIDFLGLGVAAADRLGLRRGLEEIHAPVARLVFVDEAGATRYAVGYPALRRRLFAGRHYNFLRGDLEHLLYDAAVAAGVEVLFGRRVVAVASAGGPDQPVAVSYDNGAEDEWDVVLGADGIHSRVRSSVLRPGEWATRDLGHAVWAWIIDGLVSGVPSTDFTTLTVPGRMVAAYPAGTERTATFFLLRSGAHGGEPPEELPALLGALFGDLGWRVPQLLASLPAAVDFYSDRTVQVHARTWHRGRVGLVGDACWCVSLLAGQGASLAMAGGVIAAEELAASPNDVSAALDRYRTRLQPITAPLAASGARTATWFVPEQRWRMGVRDLAMRARRRPVVGSVLGHRLGFIRTAA
jgi:2-polyprenyl-6-methoxyphenol hydroxylase-like FAD-dependent oxidoreductase